jgi:hypothetical protein
MNSPQALTFVWLVLCCVHGKDAAPKEPAMIALATVLATVPSSSNPEVVYTIRRGADGNVYCSCPAWKFQKLNPAQRTCKHLRGLAASMKQHAK